MTLDSFLNRDKKRGNKSYRRSRKQEAETAKVLGGRVTAASGSKSEKGDVRVRGVVRVENKTTQNKSFSVTLSMVEAIEEAALSSNEIPIIVIEFNDGRGRKIKDVAVLPTYALYELIERAKDA